MLSLHPYHNTKSSSLIVLFVLSPWLQQWVHEAVELGSARSLKTMTLSLTVVQFGILGVV